MDTQAVLLKIFKNPDSDLMMFDGWAGLNIYEKEAGKYYVKAISKLDEEKLVYNEKTGKSAPEEIVRQLYLIQLTKQYKYPKHLIELEKHVNFGREINGLTLWFTVRRHYQSIIEVKA